MSIVRKIRYGFSFIQRYQYRWILIIAISWTLINYIYWAYFSHSSEPGHGVYYTYSTEAAALRVTIVFMMSCLMGYLLMFGLRRAFRNLPLLLNIFLKTVALLLTALLMNFILHVSFAWFIQNLSLSDSLYNFFSESSSFAWLMEHSTGWVVLFFITQVFIESYEKYSPGVFWDILIGRYIRPKVEKRIVMFLDLKDSTPIAEKLDSPIYFSFMRDFIYYVSTALLEYDSRIYQYVGDEIVTSWQSSPRNAEKCIYALMLSERLIKKNSRYFLKRYGFIPEFKAGIHIGEVTVGEIGLIKKDIAISGDTMNTAARIRTACNDLSQKYLASKDFIDMMVSPPPLESLGDIELKGKSDSIALYVLKI
jgi:adenylate cyclase